MKALIISIVALVVSIIALFQSIDPNKAQEIKGMSCHRCGSTSVVAYKILITNTWPQKMDNTIDSDPKYVYVCANCNFVVKR